MAITVATMSAALADICGGTLIVAGLDGSAASTAWLGPIAAGLRSLGLTTATPLTTVDADLAPVADEDIDQLLSVAELRSLENALNHYTKVDQTISMGSKRFGQFRSDLEATIARRRAEIKELYGFGVATITAGVIDLSFDSIEPTT